MPQTASRRSSGAVFNQVATDYDRHRPAYPEDLIDRACEIAALAPGDDVLEIGCGSGQLTRALLARGLRVTAIEPGDRLAVLAVQNLADSGDIQILNTRLEDASFTKEGFAAVFSASAIHWVDPDVSWRRAADALATGGTLALIQYFGAEDRHSADDQRALLDVMAAFAPEAVAAWPTYRDLATTLAGVHERRANVSEAWSWLGGYDLTRQYAVDLFEDAQITASLNPLEHTAEKLNSLLTTMSFWSRLSPAQRTAVEQGNRALQQRLGRPIRSSTLACLLTARRRRAHAYSGRVPENSVDQGERT